MADWKKIGRDALDGMDTGVRGLVNSEKTKQTEKKEHIQKLLTLAQMGDPDSAQQLQAMVTTDEGAQWMTGNKNARGLKDLDDDFLTRPVFEIAKHIDWKHSAPFMKEEYRKMQEKKESWKNTMMYSGLLMNNARLG